MIKDFNEQTSLEAKFARACDKLENVLEFKKYDAHGQTDLSKGTHEMLTYPRVKEILEQGADSFGALWYRYHLPSFESLGFDENTYAEILNEIDIKNLCE